MTAQDPATLRARLVAHLRGRGDIRTPRVAEAFERVPRHLFVPSLPPEEVYTDRSIAIKLEDGIALSSSSQPAIMAEMLELLEPREGAHVLEIGTGSGYNAALLAELVGPSGSVTTIDLDEELAVAASLHLRETGYARVRTLQGDGALGDPSHAPFDALIATVGVERIPVAWITQLRVGGRLVAPLTVRAQQKVVAFERTERGLESVAIVDAGFIMLRGPSASEESRTIVLGDPNVSLRVLTENITVDADAIAEALRSRGREIAPIRRLTLLDVWDGFALWLALNDDAFCRVTAQGALAESGRVPSLLPGGDTPNGVSATLGICQGDELVVLAPRGAHDVLLRAFGPDRGLTQRLQNAIARWEGAGRPSNAMFHITVDLDGTTHTTYQ